MPLSGICLPHKFESQPAAMMYCLVIVSFLLIVTVSFAGAAVSDDYVTPHNAARQAVGAGIPNLTWDNVTLATYATKWAQHQATLESCKLRHSGGPYGENIYWSSWASVPGDAVKAWVSERPYYNYATNSCQSGKVCGHYTQIVWKNTKRVGCGSARCSGGGTFVVCSYNPPGNYIGQKPY